MDVRIGRMLKRRTLPRCTPLTSRGRAHLAPVAAVSPARMLHALRFSNVRARPPRSPVSPRASSRCTRRRAARASLRLRRLWWACWTLTLTLTPGPAPAPSPNPALALTLALPPEQAGIVLFDSFTLKTLGLKMLALALAIGSGLSIGKEGPLALALAP